MLDGAARLKDLAERAASLGMPAIAMTTTATCSGPMSSTGSARPPG
nr:PHP domain-containing protein [Nocardioides seonyuensis]